MTNKCVQFRRGTTEEHNEFTGLIGEVTVDTDKKTLVIHDEKTVGGLSLAREDLSNVNVEIIAEKGIAKSDLSNIETEKFLEKGIAKTDLSNVSIDHIIEKGIAKSDLSNVPLETICNKGIAKNDASNFTDEGKNTIASFGMPSKRYIDLSLTSGQTYIMPAHGYFCISKTSSASSQHISILNTTKNMKIGEMSCGWVGQNMSLVIPGEKNDIVKWEGTFGGATVYCKFIYANGN